MQKTPLESWISEKIFGLPGQQLTPEGIRRYQLQKLRTVVDYVSEKSPFYRERLSGLSSDSLTDPDDLSSFPFTTVQDLHEYGASFLACPNLR
jgi:phenylacetate-coenzyme A ligase PaaK-like adenylate-forming protein